jgi:hypothetical protein
MKASSLIEVLSAAHLSRYVNSNVFQQRGGIFLVAPPGMLKSTLIKCSLSCYPDALRLADLNVQSLNYISASFIDGKYSTLAFGEFEKIYMRNPATASNLEGQLKAMVEEGFAKPSFEDQRTTTFESRLLLIGGITPGCHAKMMTRWMSDGFARRFLWCFYTLDDPTAIIESIHKWKSLDFGKIVKEMPSNGSIPYSVTPSESSHIRGLIGYQPAMETTYVLMKKIFCVLKWRHKAGKKAMAILQDFAECLGEKPARLTLGKEKKK